MDLIASLVFEDLFGVLRAVVCHGFGKVEKGSAEGDL